MKNLIYNYFWKHLLRKPIWYTIIPALVISVSVSFFLCGISFGGLYLSILFYSIFMLLCIGCDYYMEDYVNDNTDRR